MLSLHPQVAGLFETMLFTGAGIEPLLRDAHWNREKAERMFDRPMGLGQFIERDEVLADLRALCDQWLSRGLSPEHRFLIEKTPADAPAVKAFAQLYPGACVIHAIRDGRDVAESVIEERAAWMRSLDPPREPRPRTRQLWSTGNAWAGQVRRLRELTRTLPVACHELRYEDMSARPRETARRLFSFCGIPCEDERLDRIVAESDFSELSGRDPQPVAPLPNWRREWSHLDCVLFAAAAGELLHELGYSSGPAPRVRVVRRALLGYERLKRVI